MVAKGASANTILYPDLLLYQPSFPQASELHACLFFLSTQLNSISEPPVQLEMKPYHEPLSSIQWNVGGNDMYHFLSCP